MASVVAWAIWLAALSAAAAAETPACPVSNALLCDPKAFIPAPAVFKARFETDIGSFVLEVARDNAPRESDRLFNLIQLGYYNDQRFFRVNGKVIQFGVHGSTDMNREIYSESCTYPGACFIGDVNKISNVRGTLSFCANIREDFCKENASTDVCGSKDKGGLIVTNEIFINTIDNPSYDAAAGTGFAPVGKVVEGMAVVDQIYNGYGEFNDPELCAKVPDVPCAGPDYTVYQDGNNYFDHEFPKMTKLIRTTILPDPKPCPVTPQSACSPSLWSQGPYRYGVDFVTDVGTFTIEVNREDAPKSADRMYNLVKQGYFHDQRFFRVNGKVIQYGVHALKEMNREFYNEDCSRPGSCFISDENKVSNLKGTLAFAANTREDLCTNMNPRADVCSDPDEGQLVLTNELFINTIDNPQYDTVGGTGFAPFGTVVSGMDVVQKIFRGYGEFNDPTLCAKVPDVPCKGPDYTKYQDGNVYFDAQFPNMTKLLKAQIMFEQSEKQVGPTTHASYGPWATKPAETATSTATVHAVPTASATEATSTFASYDSNALNGGAIAGIVIAVLVVVGGAVAAGTVVFLRRRRQERWAESATEFVGGYN